jgi:hypothetical protein
MSLTLLTLAHGIPTHPKTGRHLGSLSSPATKETGLALIGLTFETFHPHPMPDGHASIPMNIRNDLILKMGTA